MEVLLGVAGLLLALYQVRKAERAAVAARNAVIDTSANVNRYSFLLLVPELALVEKELEAAASSPDKDGTLRLLRDWQARASELRGLLSVHNLPEKTLSESVQSSIVLAGTAFSAVSKGKAIYMSTSKVREAAAEVVLLARSEAARVRANIQPPREIPSTRDDLRAVRAWFSRSNTTQKELPGG